MRVLFLKKGVFIPEQYAGTELTTHYLCLGLIERGHRVAVAASSDKPVFGIDQAANCDTTCGYPVYRARDFDEAAALSIAEFQPDAVVCHEPDRWIGSAKLGGFSGIAILLFQHAKRDWFTLVPAPIRERAAYISNSAATAAFLKNTHGVDSVIIPPVFGIDRFAGLERRGNNVLFIGIQLLKGADIAIEIARRRPNVSFIFVESWVRRPTITAQLSQAAANLPNVKLLPNRADMQSIFLATRLLLMPSRYYEGWGRTATEAQLCGIPVLGSDRGQLGSTIGPGGLTLDPDADISLWLLAFDRIWNDDTLYSELSRRAKDHAKQLVEQSEATIECFEQCLVSAVTREKADVPNMSVEAETLA